MKKYKVKKWRWWWFKKTINALSKKSWNKFIAENIFDGEYRKDAYGKGIDIIDLYGKNDSAPWHISAKYCKEVKND